MYNKKVFFIILLLLPVFCYTEARKTRNRSSGSGRGTSRRTQSPKPVPPTSFSYSQPSAPKPSLSGWQESPAQRTQTSQSKQSKPTNTQSHSYPSSNGQSHSYPSSNGQSHSYPSSNTGLSGNPNQNKQPQTVKENVQQNSASQNSHSQSSHTYPSSKGMSGNSGSGVNSQSQQGVGYPSQTGAHYPSQQGAGYPLQQGVGYQSHGGPPPPYSASRPGDYMNRQGNGAYGGHGGYSPGYGQNMPGYYGNSANYGQGFGGVSRTSKILGGVGIAGAGVGTILTGLALWNLARSTGRSHHTVIYDNRGQPVAVAPSNVTDQPVDSILGDLVNCSLTISNGDATEVLSIPCAIATSFSPDADVKLPDSNNTQDNTKCTVTVLNKAGKEFMTTISCSILLKTAAENNVTEPPLAYNVTETTENSANNTNETEILMNVNGTANNATDQPRALSLLSDQDQTKEKSCTPEVGANRDPINPCYAITHNLTVIPLDTVEHNTDMFTPGSA